MAEERKRVEECYLMEIEDDYMHNYLKRLEEIRLEILAARERRFNELVEGTVNAIIDNFLMEQFKRMLLNMLCKSIEKNCSLKLKKRKE